MDEHLHDDPTPPADYLVVGAGLAGLTLAARLGARRRVVVIDRLPFAGGVRAGLDHRLIQSAQIECRRSNVELRLGDTALKWSPDHGLLVMGPGSGIQRVRAKRLVFAGGLRPGTLAELGILGDRLGGILPVTAACHFAEAGVMLGHRVGIIGSGDWAEKIARLVRRQGCRAVIVAPEETQSDSAFADELWPGWRPVEARGNGRVSQLICEKHGERIGLDVDGVVLAHAMRPVRNVDGAILDEESLETVSFVQLVGDKLSLDDIAAHAADVAASMLDM